MIGPTAGPDDLVLSTRTLQGAGFHARLGDWAHDGERGRRSRKLEEQLLGIAVTFGARQQNVGRDVEGPPDHVARRLAELARRAAEHGVLVALEFMPFTNIADIAAAWQLVRAADEPGVGTLLDTWHPPPLRDD